MMLARKNVLALAGGDALLSACSMPGDAYRRAVIHTWRPFAAQAGRRDALLREIVRYATLAPSSHNTQGWIFRIAPDSIAIEPDFSRRCPIVDPDDHHLFVSLGCATENAVQAAAAHGLQGHVTFDDVRGRIIIAFENTRPQTSALFAAIPRRQSTRAAFDPLPLPTRELSALERAGEGNGVRIHMITSAANRNRIRDFVIAGNTSELTDPAFVSELRNWMRFNDTDAVAAGDGLMSSASGNPSLPHWLGSALLGLALRPASDGERYAKLIAQSAGIAIVVSERDDRAHWIEAGRCFERFALRATALGIQTSMLNQPLEVAAIRRDFSRAFALRGRTDLIVRFGRGHEMPRSLRRPLDAVIA